MSFRHIKGTSVWYLVLILIVNAVADISLDYYFDIDEPLRSVDNFEDCRNEETIQYCNEKCGPKHACLLGQCFCVKEYIISDDGQELLTEESDVEYAEKDLESNEENSQEEQELTHLVPYNFDTEFVERPTLRHHIAHFCPNLHKARQCIRKCMKIGKPAFCGKDHVCYCGHKYDFPGKDPKFKPSDMYRDLYEKYFGPKTYKHKKRSE